MTSSNDILGMLVGGIADGGINVVDLTQPLEPKTPILALPPEFAQNPPFEIEVLSEYDERGPAWYWNWFKWKTTTTTPSQNTIGITSPWPKVQCGWNLLLANSAKL